MEISKSTEFFKSLRGKLLNEADLYELLTDFTSGKDYNYLIHFQKNYAKYLIDQKKIKEDSFSHEEINNAIKNRKLNNEDELIVGAMSATITNDEKKRKLKEKKMKEEFQNRTNIEALMFPEEFVCLYKVKPILEEIMASLKKEEANQNIPPLNLLDLSDSNGVEKIIMLNELGILEYLKQKDPFLSSTNAMASVISCFTGMKAGTVQSKLNPIYNPTSTQKNNPLKSDKSVIKIKDKLVNIGFKPLK